MVKINIKMILSIVGIVIIICVITFVILVKSSPSLRLSLFGGVISVPPEEIKFWIEKESQRNYYSLYGEYFKCSTVVLYGGGHGLHFEGRGGVGGIVILVNPIDNKIYGWGSILGKENDWGLYYLGTGETEGKVFKPVFPKGTELTFRLPGSLEFTDAPAYYITIKIPGTLNKVADEELEEGILAEILEDYSKRYHLK